MVSSLSEGPWLGGIVDMMVPLVFLDTCWMTVCEEVCEEDCIPLKLSDIMMVFQRCHCLGYKYPQGIDSTWYKLLKQM